MAMSLPAEAYSQIYQASKMEIFCEVVNSWKPLTTFTKNSILDVLTGFWINPYPVLGPLLRNYWKDDANCERYNGTRPGDSSRCTSFFFIYVSWQRLESCGI